MAEVLTTYLLVQKKNLKQLTTIIQRLIVQKNISIYKVEVKLYIGSIGASIFIHTN